MRRLGEENLPFRIEDAYRVHRGRRKLDAMRSGELVEHGVLTLSPLEYGLVQEARLGRGRHYRAVGRHAAEHDILDHRHEELRLPFGNDRAVGVAQGDDALTEILRELQVANAVVDAPALHFGEVRVLHYYEVKRPAKLGHVLGQVQKPRPAAVRRRIAGDNRIWLYGLDVRPEARHHPVHRLAPPERPCLEDRILCLKVVHPAAVHLRKQGGGDVGEAEPAHTLVLGNSCKPLPESLLAAGAIAWIVEHVVEHDAVEAAVREGDCAHALDVLLPLAAVEARRPAEVLPAPQVLVALPVDGRPVVYGGDFPSHEFRVQRAELDVCEGLYAMGVAVPDELLHIREVVLFHLPAHALVKARVEEVEPHLRHLLGRVLVEPVKPVLHPQGIAVYAAGAVPADPAVHRVGLVGAERPARRHGIDVQRSGKHKGCYHGIFLLGGLRIELHYTEIRRFGQRTIARSVLLV